MSSTLEDIFSSCRTRIIDSNCLNQLGLAIKESTELERRTFFESAPPDELHLQLLKLYAARISGQYNILLEGIKAESKCISKFCLRDRLLFHSNSQLLNHQFLLPFLQILSHSTRRKLICNLSKYMPNDCETAADTLFHDIVSIWGTSIALPLLCRCSEGLLQQELPLIHTLSTYHLMVLAKRFPYLALVYLKQNPFQSCKVTQYIVRATLPQSLDFCKTSSNALSKTTMKIVLKKYSHIILDSPAKWVNVLDRKLVHKMLKPELLEQFISMQFMELERFPMPNALFSYFKLFPPTQVSNMMRKLLEEKYDSPLETNLDYWKENKDVLKLLDANDRNSIAIQLDAQLKGNHWVTLMSCNKSIEIIKNDLRFEADAQVRASLVRNLMETIEINHDFEALEEVCQFIAGRYQNDKNVLQAFFEKVPDLSTISNNTWSIVLALAHKFYDPRDWMTSGASKLFTYAMKRDPDMYLKMYIEGLMVSSYSDMDVLFTLKNDLRSECINLVFTKNNIENTNHSIQSSLSKFLPIISKWNEASSTPLIYSNVNKFVANLLASASRYLTEIGINFVLKKGNGFDIQIKMSSLQKASCREFLHYYLLRRLPLPNISDIADNMLKDIFKIGVFRYIRIIERMKRLGYIELVQYLAEKCKDAMNDPNLEDRKCRDVILLLSLTTANTDDYFFIIDPLLPPDDKDKTITSSSPNLEESSSCKDKTEPEQLKKSKHQEYIYKGIGQSFPYFDLPILTVDRLSRFCVNSNLMIFVRDALYSICNSLPNDLAENLILSLVHKPVSVQKHALRLHRVVCNIQSQLNLLLNLLECEAHVTTRTVLIQSAINCLNETRTVATWQVTKQIMSHLTPTDRSIVSWLIAAKVPDPFVEEYLKILLEKVKLLKDVTTDSISNVLRVICNQHTNISEQFLESLIKEYFLSAWYNENGHQQNSLFRLFMIYLKGSNLTTIRSNLACRQQCFAEILKTNATESYLYKYDSKLCQYPGRILFVQFIEVFCRDCLQQMDLTMTNETDLSKYIDILLEFVNKFDKAAFFESAVFLCLTQIGKDLSESVGQRIGKFCDASLQMHPSLTRYSLPHIMSKYFPIYFGHLNENQIITIMFDLLPPATINEHEGMLRLVIIGGILPKGWLSKNTYEPFKQIFVPLIKNTVAEITTFNY